jgi:hypothetical protein
MLAQRRLPHAPAEDPSKLSTAQTPQNTHDMVQIILFLMFVYHAFAVIDVLFASSKPKSEADQATTPAESTRTQPKLISKSREESARLQAAMLQADLAVDRGLKGLARELKIISKVQKP